MRPLRLLRCLSELCMTCIFYSVVTVLLASATDFDDRYNEYIRRLDEVFYGDRDPNSDPIAATYLNNQTCVLEGGGRYKSDFDKFVFVYPIQQNGWKIPEEAINFAGVFDKRERTEMAALRGIMICSFECKAPQFL